MCEMVDLHITKLTCSERSPYLKDWCHICRVEGLE